MLRRRLILPFVLVLLTLFTTAGLHSTPAALAMLERDGSQGNPKNESPFLMPSAPLGDFVLDTVQRYYGNSNWSPNRQSGKRAKLSSVALMSQGDRWIRAKAYVLKWKQAEKDWILSHYSNNQLQVHVIFHAFHQDTASCIGVTTSSAPDWLDTNLPGGIRFLKSNCEPRVRITNPAGIDVTHKYYFSAWFRDDSPRELDEIPLAFGWQTPDYHDAAPDDNVKKFCFGADEGRSWAPNALSIGTCRDGAPVLLNNSTYFLGTVTEGFTGQDNYLPDNEVGNDSVRSLKVNEGWQVTLFIDQNYGGLSETFTQWDPDLSNNAIGYGASSVRAIANGVTVYRDNDFNGTSEVFGDGCDPDLSNNAIGRYNITSVRVPPGWRLTLYDSTGCTGKKYVVQGIDDPWVNYGGFNDKAVSLKVDMPQTQLNNGEVGDWVPD